MGPLRGLRRLVGAALVLLAGKAAAGGDEAKPKVLTGLTVDSRAVRNGMLFAALPGVRWHGAEFIGPALRMGAAAILTDAAGARLAAEALEGAEAALVIADDPREALAYAAALWHILAHGLFKAWLFLGSSGTVSSLRSANKGIISPYPALIALAALAGAGMLMNTSHADALLPVGLALTALLSALAIAGQTCP